MIYFNSDGEIKELMTPVLHLSYTLVYTNFIFVVFNMLPIPPLDGFTVLSSSVPRSMTEILKLLEERATLIIIFLIAFGGDLIFPIAYRAADLVNGFSAQLISLFF